MLVRIWILSFMAEAWLHRHGVRKEGIHKVAHRPCRPLLYSCGILPFGHAGTAHESATEEKLEQARQDGLDADANREDRQEQGQYQVTMNFPMALPRLSSYVAGSVESGDLFRGYRQACTGRVHGVRSGRAANRKGRIADCWAVRHGKTVAAHAAGSA